MFMENEQKLPGWVDEDEENSCALEAKLRGTSDAVKLITHLEEKHQID